MRPFATLFLVALCALQSLGQATVEVTPFDAIRAKAVKVEQLADSVAVILTDREPGTKSGAYIKVTSKEKWATPLIDGVNITRTELPGEWVLFAPAGKYRLLLIEFNPETGPSYSYHNVTTGLIPGPVDPGPVDPPPAGDFTSLRKVVKDSADRIADPRSRAALIAAYTTTVQSNVKVYEELVAMTKANRRAALQLRLGDSRAKDWSIWLASVDAELAKVVTPGDSAAYIAALKAIIESLGQ